MSAFLKQSTAFTFRIGPFVDSTDGATVEPGLTIAQSDIQISKAGGPFAQTSDAAPTTTYDSDGWYQLPLTATDTGTLGTLTVQVTMSGALPVWREFMVLPANVFDSLVSGTDTLQGDLVQVGGVAQNGTNLAAACAAYSATRGLSGTALPNASADAAGGLIISDAGGLDADAILADTNELQTNQGNWLTATGFAVAGDAMTLTAAATSAQLVDDVWDEVLTAAAHNVANSAGRRLRQGFDSTVLETGTAQAGASGSITLAAGASAIDDFYEHDIIVIVAGTGQGLARKIEGYTGSTKVATVSIPWVVTPDATSEYEILTGTDAHVGHMHDNVITSGVFDESTAFPLTSADSGATAVARTGADADTLETLSDEIAALNDFDPANDAVANVTLVDTTTTNTDMVDISALALEATVGALNDFDPANDTVARVTLVDTTTTNTDVTALSIPTVEQIVTGVLAGVVDGTVDIEEALKKILAVTTGSASVSGTDPKVIAYKDAAGTSTVRTHSVPTAGTGRTAS